MARINSKAGSQSLAFDGSAAGEGLAVFLSQNSDAVARYRFIVKAMLGEGIYEVGEFYSSPPNATPVPGRLTRMIAGAVCPGATSWRVEVSAVPDPGGVIEAETADVILGSSKCCATLGVQRVAERYAYKADASISPFIGQFIVEAGMQVTGIAAIGLSGGGYVDLGGDTITVPEGVGMNLEPGTIFIPNLLISFTNVDWVVEYLESA